MHDNSIVEHILLYISDTIQYYIRGGHTTFVGLIVYYNVLMLLKLLLRQLLNIYKL